MIWKNNAQYYVQEDAIQEIIAQRRHRMEAPDEDERVELPRQQSAVAEATSQPGQESFLEMIVRTIAALHDWLAGPPMTTQDRIRRDIDQQSHKPFTIPMGGA